MAAVDNRPARYIRLTDPAEYAISFSAKHPAQRYASQRQLYPPPPGRSFALPGKDTAGGISIAVLNAAGGSAT